MKLFLRFSIHLRFHFIVLIALMNVSNLFGQNPRFRTYTLEQGLPANEVYHIMQDSKGFLWISTDRGVSRYDGKRFTNFTTSDGLLNNTVFRTYEDDEGRIWFLSTSPQLCYYKNNEITAYRHNERIDSLKMRNSAKVSMFASGDEVFVGTNSAGYYQVNQEGIAEQFTDESALILNKTPYGILINRFQSRSKASDTLLKIIIDEQEYYYPRKRSVISRLVVADSGYYFSDGLNLYNYQNQKLRQLLISEKLITSVFIDSKKLLWLGKLDGGVSCYQLKGNQLIFIKNYLPNESVSWICEDFEGGMWFSTLKSGLYYWPKDIGYIPKFEKKLPKLNVKGIKVKNDSVAYISYGDGSIWRAEFSKSPLKIDSSGTYSKNQNQPLAIHHNGDLIGSRYVLELFKKESEKITDSIQRILGLDTIIQRWVQPELKCFLIDSHDALWVGTGDGLFKFMNQQLEAVYMHPTHSDGIDRSNFNIDAIQRSRDSQLLISTYDGVYKLMGNNFQYLGDKHHLLTNRIDVISEELDGRILFGSRGEGLIVLQKESVFRLSESQGLMGSFINDVAAAGGSQILVGTNNGLYLLDFTKNPVVRKRIGQVHGLRSDYITKVAVKGGQAWIGTSKGLAIINLKTLNFGNTVPVVILDSMTAVGIPVKIDSVIELKHSQNNLTFYYTGLSYRSLQLSYSYKMIGLDTNWVLTNNNQLTYNSLPPGDYELHLKAINEEGLSSKILVLFISVNPPFWLEWWFMTILIGLSIIVVLALVKRRDNRLKERLSFQKRTIELELKALRAQMNPHFTFNTLSSIQQYILENDSLKANDYLSRFASLIRKVLENSRHKHISLQDEIETLEIYLELEKLRFSESLNYRIKIDPSINTEEVMIPPSIIQPFIENSIIHGISHLEKEGLVLIEIKKKNGTIECIITDNGVGRQRAGEIEHKRGKKEEALGMDITSERLKLMKKTEELDYHFNTFDITDVNGMVIGTKVKVVVPILTKSNKDDTSSYSR